VMADVFDADVYQLEVGNSACLGAALRAYHADALAEGHAVTWDEVVAGFAEPVAASRLRPNREHHAIYRELMNTYAACEAHARGLGPLPSIAPRTADR
jgi:sugar (pentulose or hexulose) kinase